VSPGATAHSQATQNILCRAVIEVEVVRVVAQQLPTESHVSRRGRRKLSELTKPEEEMPKRPDMAAHFIGKMTNQLYPSQ